MMFPLPTSSNLQTWVVWAEAREALPASTATSRMFRMPGERGSDHSLLTSETIQSSMAPDRDDDRDEQLDRLVREYSRSSAAPWPGWPAGGIWPTVSSTTWSRKSDRAVETPQK
jgi:hypothetical protein